MDRLISFYERIFDARVTLEGEEAGLRHAFIEIGPHTVLHPFEVPGVGVPGLSRDPPPPHRRRGERDRGADWSPTWAMLSFSFHDPDDGWHEVMWVKPDGAEEGSLTVPESG
jgi:catechol 2,3-dioxygenase-like lactoylglutathione lyase family enzyme